jgi:hypothetical protein
MYAPCAELDEEAVHEGIKMTPVAEPVTGYFDIETVLTALARGAACKVDLSDETQFDFWRLAHRSVNELCADFGISPPTAALESAA